MHRPFGTFRVESGCAYRLRCSVRGVSGIPRCPAMPIMLVVVLWVGLPARAATMAAHYDFNEGGGNVLHDVSGNGHDGNIGSATWVAEGSGFSHLSFDGIQNVIQLPAAPSFYGQISGDPNALDTQMEAAGSVEAWYKTRGDVFQGAIISLDRGGGAPSMAIGTDTAGSGNIAASLANTGSGRFLNPIGDVPAPLEQWTHVALTWNTGAGRARLYVNGAQAGSQANLSFNPELSFFPLTIGVAPYSSPDFYFRGGVDEIKFWSGELSPGEVAAAYAADRPGLSLEGRPPFTRTVFDNGDMGLNGGDGWKNEHNSARVLANSESYVMRAYTQMYRATGDAYYLDKLIDHADSVLANRDDFADFPHEVPGNYPIWSSAQDGLVSAPLTSGLVVQAMAQFLRLVNEDPVLAADPTYAAKTATYTQRVRETVDWLNANYLWDPGPGRSVYSAYFNQGGRDAPHVDATMGSIMLDLYHAGGDATLLNLADRLAREIQFTGFFSTDEGNLAWSYGYAGPSDPEDISHGAHAAPFLSHLAAEGRIISVAEASALAASLIEEAYLGDGNVTSGMEGSSPLEDRFGPLPPAHWSWGMAGGMIDLAQFDLRLLPIAEAVQIEHFGTTPEGQASALFGIAKLVRYSSVPQNALLSRTVQVGPDVYATIDTSEVTLTGPSVVTLVRQTDPADVRQITVELVGSGDEWNRLWDLSVLLDATDAPDLIGGTVLADISLRDRTGVAKQILSAVSPVGYQHSVENQEQAQWNGTLAALQTFALHASELTIPEPSTVALLALPMVLPVALRRR